MRFGEVERDIIGWMPVIPLATFPVNSVEQSKVRASFRYPPETSTSPEPGLLEEAVSANALIRVRNRGCGCVGD